MFRSKRSRALILAASVALLATAGGAQMQSLDSGSVMAAVERLKPGQYIWAPEISPQGPLLVIVNIATQRLVAYRNGVPIGVSTVSTGRPGHKTPLGVFTILQKAVHHRSSTYNNAPMPYMQRLTWYGIALHGGALPGYPASHGCIRLPHAFAPLLFSETGLGMTVVIVNQPAQLRLAPSVQYASSGFSTQAVWQPERSPSGPVSIVVSAADRRMIVLRNGVQIGSAPVNFDGVIDKVQAYVLRDATAGNYRWAKVPLPGQSGTTVSDMPAAASGRFQGSDPFRQALASVVGPGTTMVVIPDSLGMPAGVTAPQPQMAVIENEPSSVAAWLQEDTLSGGDIAR